MSPCYSLHSPSLFFYRPWPLPLSMSISLLSRSAFVLLPKFKDHLRLLPLFLPTQSSTLACTASKNAPEPDPFPSSCIVPVLIKTPSSALDPNVAFQLITLFSFLPPTSIWPRDNHSNLQKASIFLLTKHSKASHWFQNKNPKSDHGLQGLFWSNSCFLPHPLIYMGYTPLHSPLYSSPLAFSTPFKYATASCLP